MVFLDKDITMDNVQKHNICTNVPSSQAFRSYLKILSVSLGFLKLTYFIQKRESVLQCYVSPSSIERLVLNSLPAIDNTPADYVW
jgi:hypothetical protein